MKLLKFLLLCLFLINGPNNVARGSCCKKNIERECIICSQTPCECKELFSEDCNRISLKKLILLFLQKTNSQCGNAQSCQVCFHCQHKCPKKHWVAKVLKEILRKAGDSKHEEQTIRKIILKILDPSSCEECSCQDYCDPTVQKVLKAILKKAAECNCKNFPCECMLASSPCGEEFSKYWFRTNKEELRKEIAYKPQSKPPSCCMKSKCCQKNKVHNNINKYSEYPLYGELENIKCKKNQNFSKHKNKTSKICKLCKKPNELICPQYLCKHSENLFSICAEAKQCRIKPSNVEGYVALSCTQCKPINSPFVQFSPNGYPQRETSHSQNEIQIRTKFLQINDFTQPSKCQGKEVFNPFLPKCPRKKKNICNKT